MTAAVLTAPGCSPTPAAPGITAPGSTSPGSTSPGSTVPGTGLALRYRPLGDVLVAEVRSIADAPSAHTVVEVVDADLTITWSVSADGARRLSALELLHVSAVAIDGLPYGLGGMVGRAVSELVHRGRRAASDAGSLAARARVVCRADVDTDGMVPVVDSPLPSRPTGLVPGRTRLRRSVHDVAGAVRSAGALACSLDPVAAASLVSALEELADALARHGGVAAPTSADVARSRVVGAVGLSTAERVELRALLDEVGDTSGWPTLAVRLAALADRIAPWRAQRSVRPPLPVRAPVEQ
jgi:hypothetical protein